MRNLAWHFCGHTLQFPLLERVGVMCLQQQWNVSKVKDGDESDSKLSCYRFAESEPLIFIEVALMKNVAQTIQEVLWDDPPIAECEATCALFYSISSTQPGLSGINLGKFLIKRVIDVVRKDMPRISRSCFWKKWDGSDAELVIHNRS